MTQLRPLLPLSARFQPRPSSSSSSGLVPDQPACARICFLADLVTSDHPRALQLCDATIRTCADFAIICDSHASKLHTTLTWQCITALQSLVQRQRSRDRAKRFDCDLSSLRCRSHARWARPSRWLQPALLLASQPRCETFAWAGVPRFRLRRVRTSACSTVCTSLNLLDAFQSARSPPLPTDPDTTRRCVFCSCAACSDRIGPGLCAGVRCPGRPVG